MRACLRDAILFLVFFDCAFLLSVPAMAQAGGTSGTITGTVTDPTGAVVAGATVTIENPVSQYERTTKTDSSGGFQFTNVPFNSYHLTAGMIGFNSLAKDVQVHSSTPVIVPVTLAVGAGDHHRAGDGPGSGEQRGQHGHGHRHSLGQRPEYGPIPGRSGVLGVS